MEISPSTSQASLNLNTIRSRINELEEIYKNCEQDSFSEITSPDSDELMKDSANQLVSKVSEIVTEYSDFSFLGIEDIGNSLFPHAYLAHLKEELDAAEAESAKISNEIELLNRTYMEDSSELESDLEWMKCSLALISAQQDREKEKEKEDEQMECFSSGENQSNLIYTHEENKFEILKLNNQIEESKRTLKSMQDLDSIGKWFDAIEQIQDVLSGLKVIEFDGTCIRLSLRTYIPKQDVLCLQKIEETNEPYEINHEFLIEVTDGSMEIKNVELIYWVAQMVFGCNMVSNACEAGCPSFTLTCDSYVIEEYLRHLNYLFMFPNDIYIGDIVDAAKSFRFIETVLHCRRQMFSQLALMETSSSLEWFVRKAQDRIIQSTLRRLVAKSASTSRQSVEYLDRDEIIVAHLVGGVDAFMEVSQGWPITNSPLKLVSLKSSNHHAKEISLGFLCKVENIVEFLIANLIEDPCIDTHKHANSRLLASAFNNDDGGGGLKEAANSLDVHTRQNLSSFVDAVEKILVEQMHLELHSDGTSSV
ncbi:hypothetical protein DKX38_025166 [Salix brachista]|uniref:Uncharacterized protein n=1 Tax=Salix brachista TaxID=2182728 RepID=A0A5N5K107_9ROSI|nr:hypothetical protein DKX38_025166 [Salix brachista]